MRGLPGASHWRGFIRHAHEQVPFYARRLDALIAADGSLDLDAWTKLPILSRADVVRDRGQLAARSVPALHGSVSHTATPGTEHQPMTVSTTTLAAAVASCVRMRFFLWHGVPFSDAMATIRHARPPPAGKTRPWAAGWAASERGPDHELSSATPVTEQLRWLKTLGPVWLRTRASLAQQLALAVREQPALRPDLRGVLTSGEILTPGQRRLCRDFLGHAPRDLYELREAEAVALQCPGSDAYHVQSEAVLVELVDARRAPLPEGCDRARRGHSALQLRHAAHPRRHRRSRRCPRPFRTGIGERAACACAGAGCCASSASSAGRATGSPFRPAGPSRGSTTLRLHELTGVRLWQLLQRSPRGIRAASRFNGSRAGRAAVPVRPLPTSPARSAPGPRSASNGQTSPRGPAPAASNPTSIGERGQARLFVRQVVDRRDARGAQNGAVEVLPLVPVGIEQRAVSTVAPAPAHPAADGRDLVRVGRVDEQGRLGPRNREETGVRPEFDAEAGGPVVPCSRRPDIDSLRLSVT